MLNRLRIPEIGESIAEVDIVQWLKAEGDHVEKDEPLAALETAKVSLELPSPATGTLTRVLVPAGATVRVGEVVAEIDEVPARPGAGSGAVGSGASAPGAGGAKASSEAGDIAPGGAPGGGHAGAGAEPAVPRGQAARLAERMPDLVARGGGAPEPRREERVMPAAERALAEQRAVASQFQATGPGGRLLKEDVVQAGEATAAAGRKPASAAGSGRKAVASRREGAAGAAGPGEAPREAPSTATATLEERPAGQAGSATGGSSSSIPESVSYEPVPTFEPASTPGPAGAESFTPSSSTGPASFAPPSITSAGPESSAGDEGERRAEEVVRMSPIRRTIARQLLETQRNAALLTTFNEIDMGYVMSIRREYQGAFQKRHGVKLGVMSFFVKAVVDALRLVPQLNAQIRGEDIVFRKYYDIGVAIGSGRGLVVPVLRDADRMGFARIERAIEDLSKRAGDGTLRLEELEGGTFTITNGGIFGSLLSTPIVNGPQSGILGMHAIQDRPVARGGQVAIRPMMYVALSYDHRIVDGREAVFFLRRIKEVLEMPARMLLEV